MRLVATVTLTVAKMVLMILRRTLQVSMQSPSRRVVCAPSSCELSAIAAPPKAPLHLRIVPSGLDSNGQRRVQGQGPARASWAASSRWRRLRSRTASSLTLDSPSD